MRATDKFKEGDIIQLNTAGSLSIVMRVNEDTYSLYLINNNQGGIMVSKDMVNMCVLVTDILSETKGY